MTSLPSRPCRGSRPFQAISTGQVLSESELFLLLSIQNSNSSEMEQALSEKLVQAARIVEDQVDAELERLEKLDDDDLEKLRRDKLDQMKKLSNQKQEWRKKGHGEYTEISEEKEFFEVCKQSDRVVCHFYRDDTLRCKIVDKHLSILSNSHIETRFVKLNVERAPFLCKRLRIRVLPTIALIKNGKTGDYIVGFDDLGGVDDFKTDMLEWRIARSSLIFYSGDLMTPPDSAKPQTKKSFVVQKKTIRSKDEDSSDDDE
uniref:Thioredoxin domain-containing protein 9 n=1 Tax=Strigamia maritima TaxID=126957 RepID=T1IRL6_STRMM